MVTCSDDILLKITVVSAAALLIIPSKVVLSRVEYLE